MDIENFSKKLLNIKKPPVLWSSIRIDGNCFFHAIDYAFTGKLLPKKSNKVIELRQNIVSTMKTSQISGVPYEEFMNARRNGKKIPWPYAEIDVVIATSKYYQRPIIVISINRYGGVTMIRPKNVKLDPLFLICEDNVHYVPFHSNKVKITESMRNKLIQIEKNQISNGSIQDENGVYVSTFFLKDIAKEIIYPELVNSLVLTRKRLGTKRSKSKSFKSNTSKSNTLKNNITRKLQNKYNENYAKDLQKEDASLAKRMQQINANYQMAKAMQLPP
jgi:hypothetical protein